MGRKISPRMLCIGMHGGSQGWEIRKLLFVSKMFEKLNADEFTVRIDIDIEKMGLKQDPAIVFDGRAYAQARDPRQSLLR
jgi:hypothetical protein